MMSHPSDIITTIQAWDGVFIDFSERVLSPLFSYISFDTCFYCVICLASVSFLCQHPSYHRPDRVFSFSLGYKHLWEALHVGHFPMVRTRKTGYSLTATRRAHSVGFLFNVVMLELGFAISLLSSWHAKFITRYETRFQWPAQTGIECQQDMLSGDDKSYTRASGMPL